MIPPMAQAAKYFGEKSSMPPFLAMAWLSDVVEAIVCFEARNANWSCN